MHTNAEPKEANDSMNKAPAHDNRTMRAKPRDDLETKQFNH